MIEEKQQDQDLAKAIVDLVAYLSGPKIAPEDELWTSKEIGEYLKLSPITVEQRVATRPDFPEPLQPCGTVKAMKRWFAVDVKKWARQNSSKLPKGRRS
ncbi:hypothetical protein [Pseudomonas nitroreducens]|uniref:hypothetical protein n=1 Tax=Pseudomonas nitroreducens TaxID=46680 RepID=UPI00265B01A1|nr:hypothetical protein [Pseudomonas nitroreducens]MCP1646953.1 hypothetical protein [Pseudomonas nitroreducens]MCP1685529.1 hypothetical protein [Pseudomonas nitroreducens]